MGTLPAPEPIAAFVTVAGAAGRPQVNAGNSRATTPFPLGPRRDQSASVNVSPLASFWKVTGSHARAPRPGSGLSGGNPDAVSVLLTLRLTPVNLSSRTIVLVPAHGTTRTSPVIATPPGVHWVRLKNPRSGGGVVCSV